MLQDSQQTQRHQQLAHELERLVSVLKQKYQPEKIIVYGSYSNNRVKQWSDLDVAIIKNTPKSFIDRLLEVSRIVDSKVATDFVVYTPEEFAQMVKDNHFVRDEIVGKGRLIYDKNKTS